MTGTLIVNGFLKSDKFDDIYSRLKDSFERFGVALSISTNASILHALDGDIDFPQKPDFVLFWDKDISLAKALETRGIRVFNSSSAIELCDNKAKMHLALKGLPMPKTVIAPMTFPNIGFTDTDFLNKVASLLGFPIVVKECFGSFGAQVYLAKDQNELLTLVKEHERVPLLFQELVTESSGRDVRINVVGDKVITAMLRENKFGDFRSNITLGGTALPYSPTDEECSLALLATKKLGLDFAGVDILFGKDGPLLCEVNSNAHFKSTHDCTGVNLADFIAEHITNKCR